MRNLKKDIDDEQKLVKQKEKIIQKLEHKCDNLITENKHVKTELCKVKNENKKLSKNKKIKQQPSKNLPDPTIKPENVDEQKSTDFVNNSCQNAQPAALSLQQCTTSLTRSPGGSPGYSIWFTT